MSAIAAVFGPSSASQAVVRAMLGRMPQRGEGSAVATPGDDVVLGISRFAWERDPDLAGPIDVARYDGVVVVADATLYYRNELRARLSSAGAAPSGTTASHLILDAYRVWGVECARQLEGDFAFVLWDTRRRLALCCRDSIGLRPLYYGVFDETLVVASCVAGVLAHPHASDEFNLRAIGAVVAGQHYSIGAETSFQHVRPVPAGTTLRWERGVLTGPTRFWAPAAQQQTALGFDAAAAELRELLTRAVAERLPRRVAAAVWMSGGRDSTAVFAAGREALRREQRDDVLHPVCISYPEGDPGREDDVIAAVLEHWGAKANWLDSRHIPLLDAPERTAAERDEAHALLYGPWNAALAAGSREAGARVALDGNGGDQLFGWPSLSHLAGLFATFRWPSLARELWTWRRVGWRDLVRSTLLPLVPRWLLPATAWVRPSKRAIGHYMERPLPEWVRPDFVERTGIREFEHARLPAPGLGAVGREERWMLTAPFVASGMSRISERALAAGVELRSPLLDTRLIAFALTRPRHERVREGDSKWLLRAAMRGLLPDVVLASRPRRTGTTVGYSRHWMRECMPAVFKRMFEQPLDLETLGMVDGAALRRASERFESGWVDDYTRLHLYHTIEVELWLRARRSPVSVTADAAAAAFRDRHQAGAVRRSQLFHSLPLGG